MKNDKITFKVIEQTRCDGCFFDRNGICFNYFYEDKGNILCCEKEVREDGRNVIFKLMKNDKTNQ